MLEPQRFAAYRLDDAFRLVVQRDGRKHEELLQADWIVRDVGLAERTKRGVMALMRWVARGLYLSPLLWLASTVAPAPASHFLLVAFVALAVTFFALLNVFVVVSAIAWRARLRQDFVLAPPHRSAPPRQAPALEVPGRDQALPGPGNQLVVRGRIERLQTPRQPDRANAPVLVDAWSLGDQPIRLTEGYAFAVCAEDRMPVVIELIAPPIVYAPPEEGPFEAALATMTLDAAKLYRRLPVVAYRDDAEWLTLRPGDEVVVRGTIGGAIDDVTQFTLGGAEVGLTPSGNKPGTPYRASERRRGVLVRGLPGAPLVIEKA
jgi:hypothetical protein